MKSGFRSESCLRKIHLIHFVQNMVIGCFKKKKENYPEKAFEQRHTETWI